MPKLEVDSNKKSGILKLIERVIHGRKKMTAYEIQDIIKASEDDGLVNEEESDMICSIFSLRSTMVREIMVPRIDMACVSVEASVREFLETILACGHSRIPVYQNSVDNVIGLLYAKDLLKYWGLPEDQIRIRTIMRPPFFIPETKNLEQLLQEFKSKHVHLAIVIDEYGGTSGLISIEDLLEQIVGDIQDEHDQEEALFSANDDGSLTADARMSIEDLEEYFGIEIERDKFDTVGGLIFQLTGRITAIGDVVENGQLRISVLDADERKIKKVLIERVNNAETDSE